MSDPRLLLKAPTSVAGPHSARLLGRHLVDDGHISPSDLVYALDLQEKIEAQLGEILVSEGIIDPDTLLDTLAQQTNAQRIDIVKDAPHLNMAQALPAATCLEFQVIPWLWVGNVLLVATSQPSEFGALQRSQASSQVTMLPVIADPIGIRQEITRLYGYQLAQRAITCVPSSDSCRSWGKANFFRSKWTYVVGGTAIAATVYAPHWILVAATLWAALTLLLTVAIKGAGFIAQLLHKSPQLSTVLPLAQADFHLPRISMMVPLLHEKNIAGALIQRLEKLSYPKSLLEVLLVLEESDTITRKTLASTKLPPWISVIEVPDAGGITTKPRAMNYALDFCRGSIIGVWDAEDAPETDQLEKVVMRFKDAPENVVCLQGMLDYYNPRQNWISRCFTIEYATWWRLVLPGIAKLGMVIPLGGTTLFFKRAALEKLGRWDAHNVTEDADLGVRLARRGYVTELIPTVTFEEANCRPWRWVRQRSRWLKGFMITYFVHMRHPIQLIRDLGFKRFMGLQMVFLATFSQFTLAPVLWSFWITFFGISHPVHEQLGDTATLALVMLFFTSEILNITMAMVAVSGPHHRHLMKWVITTPFYFTLGALAAYKAIYEMIVTPFYWDKTEHGAK